jgi:hypothetical protein
MFAPPDAQDATFEPTTGVWFYSDPNRPDGVAQIELLNDSVEWRDYVDLAKLRPYINTERVRLVRLSPADYAAAKSSLASGAAMKG